MANERSASDPNLVDAGVVVNHQYSKSLEFETVFRRAVRGAVTTSIECFSLLRRSSEHRIARNFAGLTGFHDVFVSCNHAFAPGEEYRRWCCECPKCRFLFVSLAPFLSRSGLVEMFGRDLLDDDRQVAGYLALLGVAGWPKPFDCVGDVSDTRLALSLAAERPDWRDAAVIEAVRRAAPDAFVDAEQGGREAERLDGGHYIPPRYAGCAESIG